VLLVSLLPQLGHDDLLIMDRGFPSIWLFTLLQQRQLPFLARMDGTVACCAMLSALRSGRNGDPINRIRSRSPA
jgi:hypothetical protein